MKPILGIVIAMGPEAAALFGCRGWRTLEGRFRHRRLRDGRSELAVIQAGIGWQNARAAADRLVRQGAGALLCLGLSGGLSPDLRSGDLVVARRCLKTAGDIRQGFWDSPTVAVCRAFRLFSAEGKSVQSGVIVSPPDATLSVERKAKLWHRFRALAVDLESAAVARTAAEAGLPWLVCRAVCDPFDRAVPAAWITCLKSNGRLRPSGLGSALLDKPRLAFEFSALGIQAGKACRSLQAAWRILRRGGLAADLAVGNR